MITQHTPGPWHLDGRYVNPNDRVVIARTSFSDVSIVAHASPDEVDDLDNARLISAAPDLLEVCRELLNDQNCQCDLIQKLRAAVYKAEGRV